MLDLDRTGQINAPQLTAALEEVLNLDMVRREEMALFIKKYDSNFDGRLSLQDFQAAVSPISEEYQSILRNRDSYYERRCIPVRDFFTRETRSTLRELFRKLLHTEAACEQIRERLRT